MDFSNDVLEYVLVLDYYSSTYFEYLYSYSSTFDYSSLRTRFFTIFVLVLECRVLDVITDCFGLSAVLKMILLFSISEEKDSHNPWEGNGNKTKQHES